MAVAVSEFTGKTAFAFEQVLASATVNAIQDGIQDRYEEMADDWGLRGIVSGGAPAIAGTTVTIADILAYAGGLRIVGAGSIEYAGQAADTYYIMLDPSESSPLQGLETSAAAGDQVPIASVDWDGSTTLSNLIDLRELAGDIAETVTAADDHITAQDALDGVMECDGSGSYTAIVRGDLTGTDDQIILDEDGTGTLLGESIQLSLPQSIATDSEPQFGRMGLGQAAAEGTTLGMTETFTQQTGSTIGLNVATTLSPAGALSGGTYMQALSFLAQWNSAVNGGTNGIIYGLGANVHTAAGATGALSRADANRASIIHYGSGVLGSATGIYSLIRNDDADTEAGDITNAYNFYATAYTDKGTGVMVTRYGLYVADVSGGGLCTTQYGIYVAALSGASTNVAAYLGGDVQITGVLDASGAPAKLKTYTQSAEPDIPNDTLAIWKDSDDSKYYLVVDIGGTQKRVELVA
jgi:hypothetical protein